MVLLGVGCECWAGHLGLVGPARHGPRGDGPLKSVKWIKRQNKTSSVSSKLSPGLWLGHGRSWCHSPREKTRGSFQDV